MTSSFKNPSCFLYGPGVAKIEEAPYPAIEDQHDVVIQIAYVGVCGSDVHFWNHGGIINKVDPSRPLVMGHEASGTIHEVGTAVTSLKIGDKVAIEPGCPCRRCKSCRAGRYNLCPEMKFAADPPYSHGALTKYFKVPEDFCYKLPDFMGLDEGVLVEPLAVAVHASRLADVRSGQDVVIFGAGTIGLLCAAVAKAMGARKVVSIDVNDSRLEFVQKFAGAVTYHPAREDSAETTASNIVKFHGLNEGGDVVLEATGVESCIEAGISVLKRGGTYIQVGLGKSKVEFPIVKLSEKEINMKGCFRYNAGDYDLALHLLESKKVSVKDLITGVEPFERATIAWERTKKGDGIKNLIQGPL
ncbi:sorbitol dehydrogenase [Rhexocercosporidium sp. MPI-PUGE-AT-0058]|nr:sorbitol dehydrogenase [Rhexocercosporidium sp. MPI-PUGE-AT-0058]